jgi:hypothetical protein
MMEKTIRIRMERDNYEFLRETKEARAKRSVNESVRPRITRPSSPGSRKLTEKLRLEKLRNLPASLSVR